MNSLPFGRPVRWYRGNLHTHSTNADSAKSPRGVCAAYRRRGYDFISLTGHFNEQYGFNRVRLFCDDHRGGGWIVPK